MTMAEDNLVLVQDTDSGRFGLYHPDEDIVDQLDQGAFGFEPAGKQIVLEADNGDD